MARRPIIIGLFNPHSADPLHALAPTPQGSSGYRLWSMVNEVDPAVGKLYRHVFDRRNLLTFDADVRKPVRHWLEAKRMIETFQEGDTVVTLGNEVCRAFSENLSSPIHRTPIHPQVIDGVTWRMLPHPSGRTLAYNDPVFRRLAGMLLVDLSRE